MSWRSGVGAIGACVGLLVASVPTVAHVTLERQEAAVGSSYKGVLRVPHGCSGSPTTAIRVRLPAGLIAVKPMPKPDWELSTVTGRYPKPYTLRGAPVSEGVTEISWSGGQTIYFPVVQECEKGVHRWIEIPTGKPSSGHGEGSSEPAAALRLLPKR